MSHDHSAVILLALTALLVIVLCLLWTAQRPATPEPLTVAWREDLSVDYV